MLYPEAEHKPHIHAVPYYQLSVQRKAGVK